jgi:hypothetical protein
LTRGGGVLHLIDLTTWKETIFNVENLFNRYAFLDELWQNPA